MRYRLAGGSGMPGVVDMKRGGSAAQSWRGKTICLSRPKSPILCPNRLKTFGKGVPKTYFLNRTFG